MPFIDSIMITPHVSLVRRAAELVLHVCMLCISAAMKSTGALNQSNAPPSATGKNYQSTVILKQSEVAADCVNCTVASDWKRLPVAEPATRDKLGQIELGELQCKRCKKESL